MPNTTNFNWATPADTDLVKDGAAAIRTLGNSIDSSFVDLKGGTTGQVLTKASNTDLDFSFTTPTDQTPLTTKGDLFTFTTVDARLGVGANGTVLTADSAEATGLKWVAPSSTPTFAGCVLTKSVGQAISNSSFVDVTWDVEELDTNSFHSTVTNTDRVTIPSGYAGKYLVTAQLQYGNFSGGSNRLAVIYKNTTQIAYANVNVTRGTPFASYTCSMTVGDYFKVAAYQDSGSSNTLEGNNFTQGATIFQVIYLGV